MEGENEADHEALGEGRDEVEEAVLHEGVAGCDSPVHAPQDVPELLAKVPVEGELVEVVEGLLGELDEGGLGDPEVDEGLALLEGLGEEGEGHVN